MTIQDNTIKKLLAKTTTKITGRPTHTSIDKVMDKVAKIKTSIKMTHTSFPKGTKFGYMVAIIMSRECWKRVTALDSA